MITDFVGRILFPGQPDWLRRKQTKTMFSVVAAAVFFAVVVAAFMLFAAYQR